MARPGTKWPAGAGTPAGPVAKPNAVGVLPVTILYPSPSGVKSGRAFGAGILPPDAPRPDFPFEPSAADRAWWAAESDRRDRRPAWIFSRSDRFRALIERARGLTAYLTRERCDANDPADCAALDARLAILTGRIRRLCD